MKRTLFTCALIGLAAMLGGAAPPSVGEPLAFLDADAQLKAPFEIGERLRYAVFWKPPAGLRWIIPDIQAGQVELTVAEVKHEGKEVLRISATATTLGFVRRRIMEVDNRFESMIDRRSFRSYQLKKVIRQGEKSRKDVVTKFDYDSNQAVVETLDLRKDPPARERKVFEGLPGPITDVLSVFYVARLRPLEMGKRYLLHLADEKEPKRVEVDILREERIKIRLGQFDSLRISTTGAIFRDGGGFLVWYSTDSDRVPIRFQAEAKIGKVYGELVGIDSGRVSRSVIRQ